ncbi:MAG: hypothetical protein E5V21_01900 [Mesorhizobium sp.]|nr:MAG: hypothetical protein E5V21_01900 [Mesorhizobium sp.]
MHRLYGVLLVMLLAVGGCTAVLDTQNYAPEDQARGQGCIGSASSYSLPKGIIELQVVESEGVRQRYDVLAKSIKWVTDPAYGPYCLDYLGSAFAEDALGIQKHDASEALTRIANRSVDKSKDITISLLEAAGDAAAAAAAGGRSVDLDSKISIDGKTVVYANFELDPFDYNQMRMINDSLKKIGYCVFIDAPLFRDRISQRCAAFRLEGSARRAGPTGSGGLHEAGHPLPASHRLHASRHETG